MANGEIAAQVRAFLGKKGKIPIATALQFSLTLQLQLYEKFDSVMARIEAVEKRQDAQENKIDTLAPQAEVDEVKRKSVVDWVEKHPKAALVILGVLVTVDVRGIIVHMLTVAGIIH